MQRSAKFLRIKSKIEFYNYCRNSYFLLCCNKEEREKVAYMLRRLTKRGTVTIPKENLIHIGAKPGDYFEVSDNGTSIILTPKVIEDKFSNEEWQKLELLAKEAGKRYRTAEAAKKHLENLAK
jgi:AbrB family looped-hinge helix DNA binding protein